MRNNEAIWMNETKNEKRAASDKPCIFVATPCHSECSIHYTQALLRFQQECYKRNIMVSFSIIKSSLVTQGRNLCVSNFMEENEKHNYTHFLFVDSDIDFDSKTIFKMIEADKDVIGAPYTLKSIDWNKIIKRANGKAMGPEQLSRQGFTWPLKMEGKNEVKVENGVMEATHVATGLLLIKTQVFEKMIDAYPELKIEQPTIINGQEKSKPYFYNFFDTLHDPVTKRYYGEDFGFCMRWSKIGGKLHMYVLDEVSHIGEYRYTGRLMDDLQQNLKKIDDTTKNK